MEQAWGMPSVLVTKGAERDVALMTLTARGLPGASSSMAGRRYDHEAMPYGEFRHAMYANDRPDARAVPSWMLYDQQAKNRYLFLGTGRRSLARGYASESSALPTIATLAADFEVAPAVLEQTVERFNGFARVGRDEDFNRGESAYDCFYGDSTLPTPRLGPLERGPIYACACRPGTSDERRPRRRRALPRAHRRTAMCCPASMRRATARRA